VVCARLLNRVFVMTLLTCNLFLFSWAKSHKKKGRSCGHETGVPPRRRRRIIKTTKPEKKSAKKIHKRMMRKMRKMRRRILSFFIRTKGMWMVMLFLVFGFLRTYS